MKKIICLILLICSVFCLCGCSAREVISSDKQEYIVSSLGFDEENGKYVMYMEAIVVNTDDMAAEKQNIIFEGKGKTINEAYGEIIAKITQPISLGHNGVTIIGESVTPDMLKEILDFCSENSQLNIGTFLLSCSSAKGLLSCKPLSSVSVGYDLMSMIEVIEEETGQIFENRLYQVRSRVSKPLKMFSLPFIKIEGKKFFFDGTVVFKDYKGAVKLDRAKSSIYSLITDKISRGEITVSGEKIKINFSKTTYDFSFDDNLKIKVNMRLKTDGKSGVLKKKTEELLKEQKAQGVDIFGFLNIIEERNLKQWGKIKENYGEYFRKAKIVVNVNE